MGDGVCALRLMSEIIFGHWDTLCLGRNIAPSIRSVELVRVVGYGFLRLSRVVVHSVISILGTTGQSSSVPT